MDDNKIFEKYFTNNLNCSKNNINKRYLKAYRNMKEISSKNVRKYNIKNKVDRKQKI